MNQHVEHQLTLFLDGELPQEECRAIEAHLASCAGCRSALAREKRLLMALHQARPLYEAPESLRLRIEQTLSHSRPFFGVARRHVWLLLATVLLVAMGVSGFLMLWLRSGTLSEPSEFAHLAVDTHQQYAQGQLPLEIVTNSHDEVSTWFGGKLPFNLKLPDFPLDPGQSKPYEITGARLIGSGKETAAFVAYRLGRRHISLLVTAGTAAVPTGGVEIPWQGFRLRLDAINGWRVLSWSEEGLTYVLVSDFEGRGKTFCNVCHPGGQDLPMLDGWKKP